MQPMAAPLTTSVTLAAFRASIVAMLGENGANVADDDNLLDAGLDSMRAMNLAMEWGEAGIPLDFADLAEAPSIGALYALLAERQGGAAA